MSSADRSAPAGENHRLHRGLAGPLHSANRARPDASSQGAFLEIGHPKEILIIAQTAAASFHIRLLQVDVVLMFRVPRNLIIHPQLDVFAFVSPNAFCAEVFAKSGDQSIIAGDVARSSMRVLVSMSALACATASSTERVECPTLNPISHSK